MPSATEITGHSGERLIAEKASLVKQWERVMVQAPLDLGMCKWEQVTRSRRSSPVNRRS